MKAVIVGGGVIGLSLAVELRNKGLEVTVVDRGSAAGEASPAAGGMLAPQLEGKGPGPFFDLCLRSRAMYGKWTQQLEADTGLEVGFLECGALELGFDDAAPHHLEAMVAWQKALGLRAEVLDARQARDLVPSLAEGVTCAAHLPDDAQVDTRKLMHALSVAAQRGGTVVHRGDVRRVVVQAGRATGVELRDGPLAADVVILAAGAWSAQVEGTGLGPQALKPIRGQMAELQLPARPFVPMLARPGGYAVPRADGRVVIGTTSEDVGFQSLVTPEGEAHLARTARSLSVALEGARFGSTWAGLRPSTPDGLPVLGPSGVEGLVLATGHFRNGILLAPITARAIAQLVAGEKQSVDLTPFRCGRL